MADKSKQEDSTRIYKSKNSLFNKQVLVRIINLLSLTVMAELVERIANGWDNLVALDKAVLLVGLSNTGKSTFAELVNKYQHAKPHPSLTFENDKYLLENIISAKSIKIQTTQPIPYPPLSAEDLTLLDVPCYCMPPQLKKWSFLDQKLTVNLMMKSAKKVGFLLFIEEKNTRTNVNNWKKTFYGWLEMFKQFPEELTSSVGWIITKCPADITEESVSKRIQNLQNAVKIEKTTYSPIIDRIFQNILSNNLFYISKKGTASDKLEGEEIRNIYKHLVNLPSYLPSRDHLHLKMSISGDEEAILKGYLQNADTAFCKILQALQQMLTTLKEFSPAACQQIKNSHYVKKDLQISVSQGIKILLRDKAKRCELWQVIKAFKLTKNIIKVDKSNLHDILKMAMAFPVFYRDTPDQVEFQLISQAVFLNLNLNLQFTFPSTTNKLSDIFNQNRNNFFSHLSELAPLQDNQQFYEETIVLLEEDGPDLNPKAKQLLHFCHDSVLKFKDSKKLLQKMMEQVQSRSSDKQLEAAYKTASTMQKQGFIKEAGRIFQIIKCPGQALRCIDKVQIQEEQEAIDLIDYLTQLCLFEQARSKCYKLSSHFGLSSRAVFGKQLSNVMVRQKEYGRRQGQNELLLEVRLSVEQVRLVLEMTKHIMSQLKQS